MQIWAQTMVKNEEKWLWYSVSSIINHIDKILLWDTGSTDGSREIEKELVIKFPGKIELTERKITSSSDFRDARQEMLDHTLSDWFLVVDGDEIWYEDSIKKVVEEIKKEGNDIESVVVPTINLVGDIFHYQEKSAGRYKFGDKVGHYNLRAVKRNIPRLHSQGVHGVWGWADGENKMIQDRDPGKMRFIDAPYLHATFLPRGESRANDLEVVKRSKKLKYELGDNFPLDFYYPEVFFIDRSEIVPSPWNVMSGNFRFRAFFKLRFEKLKEEFGKGKPATKR